MAPTPSALALAEARDAERRRRLRRVLLATIAGFGIALSFALALVPGSTGAAIVTAGGSIALLVVRVLEPRLPEWVSLTALSVVTLVVLFAGPISTGQVGGRAFFVGLVVLIILATAPRPSAVLALLLPVVLLLMIWWMTLDTLPSADGEQLPWALVAMQGVLLAAGTSIALAILLSLVDAAAADRDDERRRVEELASEELVLNQQLEKVVAERTAHLEAAIRHRDQLAADLREASTVDPGSGLPNQRRWEAQLPLTLARARESLALVCVVVIDLDEFSAINDRLGHVIGDEVIRRVAHRLLMTAGPDAGVSRIGGEEFALAFTGVDEAMAVERCHLLQAAVAAEAWSEIDPTLAPTFSAGVVEVSPDAVGDVSSVAREALHRADLAMQRAKRAGRNRILAADPL